MNSSLKLFTSIFYDARLLRHFLRHYSAAGIGAFYIAAPSAFAQEIEERRLEYPIIVCATDLRHSLYRGRIASNEMRRLREEFQREDEWALIVDLDEFITFRRDPSAVIGSAEAEGANVVRAVMHDRFSPDGRAVDFAPGDDLARRYPVRTRFVRDVMLGCDHKAVLVKGLLHGVPGAEHHEMVGEKIASEVLDIEHYKWTGGSVERARQRLWGLEEAGSEWSAEYGRAVTHYETHGRFAWELIGGELTTCIAGAETDQSDSGI
ncbi:MAG: hypothetical protein WAK93_09010 [Solirubrobacteraceae bacterium]